MLCRWTFGPTLWVSSSGFGRFPALMPVPRAVLPDNLKSVFTLRLYCTLIYPRKVFGVFFRCCLNYLLAISVIADCLHEHSVRYYLLDSNLFRYSRYLLYYVKFRAASKCKIMFFTRKRSQLIYFPSSRKILPETILNAEEFLCKRKISLMVVYSS